MFLYQTNGIRATYYTVGTGEIDVTDLNSKCVLNLNQNEITCSNAVTLKTAPQNVLPFAHFKLTNFGVIAAECQGYTGLERPFQSPFLRHLSH